MSNVYREEFESWPQFVGALVRDPQEPGGMDRRLRYAAATGLNEGIASEGGFLIPDEMAVDLWEGTTDTGVLLGLCDRQPVTTGNALEIPAIDEDSRVAGSRFGGVQIFYAPEAGGVTATKPKYRSMNLKLKKLLGITYATEELVADVPALAAWLRRIFSMEASFVVENDVVNGSGAGRPQGVLNSGALLTGAKESGQSADTVVAANLNGMAARLWGPSHRKAVWLMGNDAFAQISDASFSNGSPVVTTDAAGQRRILSMPLHLSEYPATLGDKGDVVLGDFSQYLIAEKEPGFVSSIHVRFLWDESVFRFTWRIDGQSAWASPLTPKNSAVTQSPWVTLAERA